MPDFFGSKVLKISLDIKILPFSAHLHNLCLSVVAWKLFFVNQLTRVQIMQPELIAMRIRKTFYVIIVSFICLFNQFAIGNAKR